jgi:mono/diheme cytochrome c family protein
VLLALSSAQKAGLAGMGAAFIVFALISSMLIPRYRPEFPARLLGVFLGLVGLFTAAMLLTVFFVARETGEEEAAAKPGETTATTGTSTTPAPPAGNAAAGKAIFAAQGCVSCHTFKPAGATGKVGPDLDNLARDAQKANQGSLEQYTFTSIENPEAYIVPGFPKGVMPNFGQTLSRKQIADLVAFLTKSS